MSSLNVRIVGTKIQLSATFRNQLGELANPSSVTAEVRLPDDTVVDLTNEVSNPSLGVFEVPFTVEMNGLHQYRIAGTGDIAVAGEGSFYGQTEFSE